MAKTTLKTRFFNWLFKEQMNQMKRMNDDTLMFWKNSKANYENCQRLEKQLKDTVGSIQVATDIHLKSTSWAVICLQGEKADFIKFVDLDQRSIEDIAHYLRQFERHNVVADMPYCVPKNEFFRIDR